MRTTYHSHMTETAWAKHATDTHEQTVHLRGVVRADDDGRYTVSLRRVVYVKRFMREGRVGFTAA